MPQPLVDPPELKQHAMRGNPPMEAWSCTRIEEDQAHAELR